MRDNDVDMWINVIRSGDPDRSMQLHFGPVWGYVIFSDPGAGRIERAIFGSGGHTDLFDHFGSDEISRAIEGYDYGLVDASVYDELRQYIAERDPETIAINSSDWLAIADGMSHSQYLKLESVLGEQYARRFVSAEHLITDFRSRRTQSEIIEFSKALEIHRQLLIRALSREVNYSRCDHSRRCRALGRGGGAAAGGVLRCRQLHPLAPASCIRAVSDTTEPPDVRWRIHDPRHVIQRGDFMTYDISVRHLEYFTTDYKRNAYVFRRAKRIHPFEHPACVRPRDSGPRHHAPAHPRGAYCKADA